MMKKSHFTDPEFTISCAASFEEAKIIIDDFVKAAEKYIKLMAELGIQIEIIEKPIMKETP